MNSCSLLSASMFSPLVGVLLLLFFGRDQTEAQKKHLKIISLFSSLVTFILSLLLYFKFNLNNGTKFQLEEKYHWFEKYNISFHIGIDSISLSLILLTSLLMVLCILCSWRSIHYKLKEYFIFLLLLEFLIIGVFSALDFVLFYMLFEAVLIPIFFIIGIWGGEKRVYATYKFFLYNLLGSIFLLIAMIYIYQKTGTANIIDVTEIMSQADFKIQRWLWIAFFLSFAIKIPMWPFHTWLPDAHAQAPTAGSVMLAGILLKMGGYGFLRFSLPMLPEASIYFSHLVYVLSVIAIVYASLLAFVQDDMKKLIAYASIAHMGYVTLGIFSLNNQGVSGAMIQMISHGLIFAGLFLVVGILSDRMGTTKISKYGGVTKSMPLFATLFLILTISSIALPGTSAFIGEFLTLNAMYKVNKFYSIFATSGMILGAIYMLWLYARVMFGKVKNRKVAVLKDINLIEAVTIVPLILLVVVIGIYPAVVLDIIAQTVKSIVGVF
jgi:NADH-quinone oxidoreductase subunit M